MGKISIPEQVKIARLEVKLTKSNSLEAHEIPIGIGKGEIAIVLASYFEVRQSASSSSGAKCWLYKKSEEHVPTVSGWDDEGGGWQRDEAVFDTFNGQQIVLSSVGVFDKIERLYKVYPYPLALIRDPSLLANGTQTLPVTVLLWYMLQKVTDAELAQLMVKDHA